LIDSGGVQGPRIRNQRELTAPGRALNLRSNCFVARREVGIADEGFRVALPASLRGQLLF
jgi:hypothetical protein